jgi:hypothetical protein
LLQVAIAGCCRLLVVAGCYCRLLQVAGCCGRWLLQVAGCCGRWLLQVAGCCGRWLLQVAGCCGLAVAGCRLLLQAVAVQWVAAKLLLLPTLVCMLLDLSFLPFSIPKLF